LFLNAYGRLLNARETPTPKPQLSAEIHSFLPSCNFGLVFSYVGTAVLNKQLAACRCKKTVIRLLVEIGGVCADYQDYAFRNLR